MHPFYLEVTDGEGEGADGVRVRIAHSGYRGPPLLLSTVSHLLRRALVGGLQGRGGGGGLFSLVFPKNFAPFPEGVLHAILGSES
jgi:hypothetical protein